MFDQYTYKVKLRALLVVAVLLGYTAYKRSFSTLIGLVKENRELSERTEQMGDTYININTLSAEIKAIDKVLGKQLQDKEKIQQSIMAFTATHNRHSSIYNLAPIHTFEDENFRIYTNRLEVTGNADQLLQLSYDFEKNFDVSRIVGLNFYTVTKGNTRPLLHLNMIFQNYENNN